MTVKLIAFIALLEYAFLKPYIIPKDPDGDESTDFIGYCLSMALFASFGEASLKGLPDKARKTVLRHGLVGGALGYAWLLFYVPFVERQMQHLFVANCMLLVGVMFGSWRERRKKIRSRWR